MAEILTRTYTYTGQAAWKSGESAVALSSFTVTGDKRPITQILSISASWYRCHDTSSTVIHAAELVFSNGTTFKSNAVSKRKDQGTFKIETSFMDMPDASTWKEANITLRTTLSTKLTSVYWTATAAQPMVLTITYLSSEFKPYIRNAKLYRANSMGAAADDGTNLSFTATLAVEKPGADGSGTLAIYDFGADKPFFSESFDLDPETLSAEVSAAPIPGVSVLEGEKKWFRMEFSYYAKTNSVGYSTETASATFLITNVFTNVHLAGTKNGGVAFGKYSASTDDKPMFECKYPAYFLGGIAQIGDGSGNLLELLGVEHGSIASMNLPGDSTSTLQVTFPRAFASAPDVVCTFDSSNVVDFKDGRWDYLTLTVYNITATGFTIRVHNGTSTSFTPGIRWIAVGTPTK